MSAKIIEKTASGVAASINKISAKSFESGKNFKIEIAKIGAKNNFKKIARVAKFFAAKFFKLKPETATPKIKIESGIDARPKVSTEFTKKCGNEIFVKLKKSATKIAQKIGILKISKNDFWKFPVPPAAKKVPKVDKKVAPKKVMNKTGAIAASPKSATQSGNPKLVIFPPHEKTWKILFSAEIFNGKNLAKIAAAKITEI